MGKPNAHNYASARHLSCEGCRSRKSKCSRTFPCVSCAVRGDDCIWLDTEPAHGILQSSLEENFAEIRRLNKVVVQLQALLIERDGRGGINSNNNNNNNNNNSDNLAIFNVNATLPPPPPSVVTPPTPPGLDYLPVALGTSGLPSSRATPATVNPRAYGTTLGSGDAFGLPAPAPPPMLRTQSDYAFGMMPPPAPPMMSRTRSDFGYRFPSPTSHHPAAAAVAADYAHSLSAQPRYALPPMYQQQQQQHHHAHVQQPEDSQEVLAISPSQLSSSPVMPPPPNRTRSTTWPSLSSLVAADPSATATATLTSTSTSTSEEQNPFALPLPFSSDPSQNQSQCYQSTDQSVSISHHHHHHQPPPMNNRDLAPSSPHSLKLDAAVTLAKGLAAANHRSFAMALDDDDDDEDGLPQRHRYPVAAMDRLEVEEDHHVRENDADDDDDDLYALPIPPPGCGPATAPTELVQLATMAVSRQGSVDFHPDRDSATGGDASLFAAAPQEKEGPGMLDSQQSSSAGMGYNPSSSSSASAPAMVTDADGAAEDPSWLFRLPQY